MTAVCDKQQSNVIDTNDGLFLTIGILSDTVVSFFLWVGKTCVAISDKIFVGVLNHFPTYIL